MEGVEKVNVSTILLPITGTLQCLTWSLLYQIARRAFASVISLKRLPYSEKTFHTKDSNFVLISNIFHNLCWKRGGLIVVTLDAGTSGAGSSPGLVIVLSS